MIIAKVPYKKPSVTCVAINGLVENYTIELLIFHVPQYLYHPNQPYYALQLDLCCYHSGNKVLVPSSRPTNKWPSLDGCCVLHRDACCYIAFIGRFAKYIGENAHQRGFEARSGCWLLNYRSFERGGRIQ